MSRVTKTMQKVAWVEVVCGVDHSSIYVPGVGWTCRYARGFVSYKDTGIIVYKHDCHRCNGFWLMKANTPPEKRRCTNCHGPAIPSGQPSCWPDLVVLKNFLDSDVEPELA